jgi:4-hydroxybenzoate polyprenyltransferase
MSTMTITSSAAIDGVSVCLNSQTLDVLSVMDYTKEVGATYSPLTTGDQQPTVLAQVFIENTGTETALIRLTNDAASIYYFTAIAPGCHMCCPIQSNTTYFTDTAARAETGTTTLRIVALYI